MFGDFSTDDYVLTAEWALFIVSSIFMPLVMLNLIIAIMSDTYERVTSGMVEADGKELNSLILEQESLMFYARDEQVSNHLHWAQQSEEQGGEWQGRVKAI